MTTTRDRLLDATEVVIAREGIRRAQVRQIVEIAGQRNTSALHYYFGSFEAAVAEVVDRHREAVEGVRCEVVAEIGPNPSCEQIVRAMVGPLIGRLDTESGRRYLQILPEVIADHGWEVERPAGLAAPGLTECHRLLVKAQPGLTRAVLDDRFSSALLAATTLLAQRARVLDDAGNHSRLPPARYRANLIAMITGMITAP